YWDDDSYRMWDLDTMDGFGGGAGASDVPATHPSDALFERVKNGQGTGQGDAGTMDADPKLPAGGWPAFAHLPKPDGHTILVFTGPNGDNNTPGLEIWDTTKDEAYHALTDMGEVTKTAAKPFLAQDADGNNLTGVCIA